MDLFVDFDFETHVVGAHPHLVVPIILLEFGLESCWIWTRFIYFFLSDLNELVI